MYNRSMKRGAAILTMLLAAGVLRAAEITQARWHGPDFILSFSDSTAYMIDLLESDSSQLVIRFPGATQGSDLALESSEDNGDHRAAITGENSGLRLTIAGRGRLGYSTEWLPYSHRLVVHTFDWKNLTYQEQQFHKGLLALEAHLDDRAAEMLGVAYATGDRRAGAALGVHYARLGKDSIARKYLGNPSGAEEFLALADVDRRRKDTAGARASEQQARELLAREGAPRREAPAMYPAPPERRAEAAGSDGARPRRIYNRHWIAVGIVVIALLLGLVIWSIWASITRKGRARQRRQEAAGAPPPPAPQSEARTQRGPAPVPPTRTEQPREVTPTIGTPLRETQTTIPPMASTAWTSVPPAPAPTVSEPKPEPEQTSPTATTAKETPEPAASERQPVEMQIPPTSVPVASAEPLAPPAPPVPPVPMASVPEPAAPAPEPQHEPERAISVQAAEVRQRIQSQRKDMPAPAESTVAAARRLHVSRDNVELRRRIAEAAKKKDDDR